ncbi:uncharacterized protein LOC141632286 [Silene latifolia]|uniref:uncharacterized protein LOC141632286 n=1 Tax=Silene latifolia TaxID=37657 RepID=UPI003D787780
MVKAWLRNSIHTKLHPSIAFSGTVVEIWKELRDRYSTGNAPRVHQLKSDLNECKQAKNQSVVEYYTQLKALWDELATHNKVPQCTCGAAAAILKEREEEKVHQFLMGLDGTLYGNVRSNLLMEDEIASLNRAYAIVLREERHHAVTIKVKEEPSEAAMAVQRGAGSSSGDSAKDNEDTGVIWCTHCKKLWHTEANCWEKLGIRGRGRGRHGGRGKGGRGRGASQQANAATVNEGDTAGFTPDEVLQIRTLLSNKAEGSQPKSGMDDIRCIRWLIDSGCSHHMTGRRDLLKNVWRGKASTVSLPDGSQMVAQEHGSVDQSTRMKIGRGEHSDGVYYFKGDQGNQTAHTDMNVEEQVIPHEELVQADARPVSAEGKGTSAETEDSNAEGRGARKKFDPYWKKDYICKSTRLINPTVNAHSSQSTSKGKGTRYPLINYVTTNCFSKNYRGFLAKVDAIREPCNYKEASKIKEWQEAMAKEFDALEANGTWSIVDLPKGKRPIGCRWVYKVKYKADGTLER